MNCNQSFIIEHIQTLPTSCKPFAEEHTSIKNPNFLQTQAQPCSVYRQYIYCLYIYIPKISEGACSNAAERYSRRETCCSPRAYARDVAREKNFKDLASQWFTVQTKRLTQCVKLSLKSPPKCSLNVPLNVKLSLKSPPECRQKCSTRCDKLLEITTQPTAVQVRGKGVGVVFQCS